MCVVAARPPRVGRGARFPASMQWTCEGVHRRRSLPTGLARAGWAHHGVADSPRRRSYGSARTCPAMCCVAVVGAGAGAAGAGAGEAAGDGAAGRVVAGADVAAGAAGSTRPCPAMGLRAATACTPPRGCDAPQVGCCHHTRPTQTGQSTTSAQPRAPAPSAQGVTAASNVRARCGVTRVAVVAWTWVPRMVDPRCARTALPAVFDAMLPS